MHEQPTRFDRQDLQHLLLHGEVPLLLRLLVRRGLLELRPQPEGQATYQTTPKFLELFQLASLADLPPADAPPG